MDDGIISTMKNIRLLRRYSQFDGKTEEFEFTYDINAPELNKLKEDFRLTELCTGLDDFNICIALAGLISKQVKHAGYSNVDLFDAYKIIDFCLFTNVGVSCIMIAIVMQELLLSVGIKSKLIQMKSSFSKIYDSHWTNQVYLRETKRWIMIDPTFGKYCSVDDRLLGVYEIREKICNQEKFKIHDIPAPNTMSNEKYFGLLSQNLFQLDTFLHYRYRTYIMKGQARINIAPIGFDVIRYQKEHNDFYYKNHSPNDSLGDKVYCEQINNLIFSNNLTLLNC